MSVKRNIDMAGMILGTLKDLVPGEASPKQLMGPVGIAQLSGESAQAGWIALLGLMASISLNLGLLNLMPNKVKTETQFARLLGASPLQVELTLVKVTGHVPRNTSSEPRLSNALSVISTSRSCGESWARESAR